MENILQHLYRKTIKFTMLVKVKVPILHVKENYYLWATKK